MVKSGLKIVELTAENVKRISAVHIVPGDDGVVLLGGKNGAGKSSVLDAIMFALGGASRFPEEPIRRGEDSATIRVDLGDMVVTRRFTAGGSTVKVSTHDGASYGSPQKILDGLFSRLTFDPLKFANMKPDDQSRTLIDLVGIDTLALDKERAAAYEERTGVNRLVKEAETRVGMIPDVTQALPDSRPDAGDLLKRIETAIAEQAKRDRCIEQRDRRAAELDEVEVSLANLVKEQQSMETSWSEVRTQIHQRQVARTNELSARHEKEIEELHRRHADEDARLLADIGAENDTFDQRKVEAVAANASEIVTVKERIESLDQLLSVEDEAPEIEDVDALKRQLEESAALSRLWDAREKRREAEAIAENHRKSSEALTNRIADIDEKKREKLAAVTYPIDGLAVSENGSVLFNGIPFSQASRAQKIRTSVAIGAAMNPKLKVLLIEDGSLLDDDGLLLVAGLAAEYGFQIWIERVGDKDASAIIIEDGHVRGVEPAVKEEVAEKPAKKRKGKKADLFEEEAAV